MISSERPEAVVYLPTRWKVSQKGALADSDRTAKTWAMTSEQSLNVSNSSFFDSANASSLMFDDSEDSLEISTEDLQTRRSSRNKSTRRRKSDPEFLKHLEDESDTKQKVGGSSTTKRSSSTKERTRKGRSENKARQANINYDSYSADVDYFFESLESGRAMMKTSAASRKLRRPSIVDHLDLDDIVRTQEQSEGILATQLDLSYGDRLCASQVGFPLIE